MKFKRSQIGCYSFEQTFTPTDATAATILAPAGIESETIYLLPFGGDQNNTVVDGGLIGGLSLLVGGILVAGAAILAVAAARRRRTE